MTGSAPFVARPIFLRLGILTLASFGVAALGLWIAGLVGGAPSARWQWIGWEFIIGFGALGIYGLTRLLDRSDLIVIDGRGLYWRQWSDKTVPWNAIASIEERHIYYQTFLSIELTDPALYRSTRLMGRLSGLNKRMGYSDMALSAAATDKSFAQLRDAVAAHWRF